jgi:uncharacterized membrane protein YgcG
MRKCRNLFLTALIGLFICLSVEPAVAQDQYPSTDEECYNDHAGTISKGDRKAIKSLCRMAKKEKVILMVVTSKSLDDFQPRPLSVDRFVDDVFNDLDVDYEEGKDAVLLFISAKENEFRIVMGDNYSENLRKKASKIIRGTLVPDFRRRKRSRGIKKTFSRIFYEIASPHIKELKKAKKRKPTVMQGP